MTFFGGDGVAEMIDDYGGDGRTETTTVWDTGTDISEADVVTDADPEILGPTLRDPAYTGG